MTAGDRLADYFKEAMVRVCTLEAQLEAAHARITELEAKKTTKKEPK